MSIHEASYTSITSTHCLSSAMLSAIDDYCLDLLVHWFPKWRSGKESAWNAGNLDLIPDSGRSSGGGNDNPLQYSCLENSTDKEAWRATVHRVAKSWTQLSHWQTHTSQSLSCSCSFSLVAQLCPTLWDPMECSTLGFPVQHQVPELAQTHVHWVGDAIQRSHPLSSPSSPALNLFQHQGLFQWVGSSHQVPKYWSFSFSISPSNAYSGLISFRIDWFDLLTVQATLKSLLQHHSSKASILSCSPFYIYSPTLTSIHDYQKNHSLD